MRGEQIGIMECTKAIYENSSEKNIWISSVSQRYLGFVSQIEIYGFLFKKELLKKTGGFNEKLSVGSNYELICRLAQQTVVFCVSCGATAGAAIAEEAGLSVGLPLTLAYILRRNWSELQKLQMCEKVLQNFSGKMYQCSMLPVLQKNKGTV